MHPGYGFLAENADFAQAVLDAGLIWIGPPPSAIVALGDKVKARHIAQRAGAPLVAGTADPVSGSDEVVAFASEFGLPVAIKAAFGGGGRGMRVARTLEEIPELYDSAVREAVSAFGRGECFVERYLDRPRHVETQCLADTHGNVVVVSTRDCSLQRRHQKLVEEAPAPYLSQAQVDELYRASKAILTEAGYVGAGTCEFLVGQDGTISFLEVNTRLQVEHPVSEEVTGLDLVREMFRIADGEALGYGDPEIRGHSIEFRINAEDGGRGFFPAPGTLTAWRPPTGPGVRLDSGYELGETIPGMFDSLVAKLVITGASREQALERSRRALDEFVVDGMPTVIPFHASVVRDPAFAPAAGVPFSVHTRWIETEYDNQLTAYAGADRGRPGGRRARAPHRRGRRAAARGRPARGLRGRGRRRRRRRRRRQARPARRDAQDRRGGRRRRADLADAGHDRQGRGLGRRAGRGRRPDRRPRGDEDGAAPERAQGRHGQWTVGGGRRDGQQRLGAVRDQGLTTGRPARLLAALALAAATVCVPAPATAADGVGADTVAEIVDALRADRLYVDPGIGETFAEGQISQLQIRIGQAETPIFLAILATDEVIQASEEQSRQALANEPTGEPTDEPTDDPADGEIDEPLDPADETAEPLDTLDPEPAVDPGPAATANATPGPTPAASPSASASASPSASATGDGGGLPGEIARAMNVPGTFAVVEGTSFARHVHGHPRRRDARRRGDRERGRHNDCTARVRRRGGRGGRPGRRAGAACDDEKTGTGLHDVGARPGRGGRRAAPRPPPANPSHRRNLEHGTLAPQHRTAPAAAAQGLSPGSSSGASCA